MSQSSMEIKSVLPAQRLAGFFSILLSAIVMVLGFSWWVGDNPTLTNGYLGTFNSCTIHATLMLFSVCFCLSSAVQSYNVVEPLAGHFAAKISHACWHTVAVAIIIAALVEIVKFHDYNKWGHLSTLHSWLGLFFLTAYLLNFVGGGISFLIPQISPEFRAAYLPSHRFLGIVTLLLATVAMLTGIMQKTWLDGAGCFYVLPTAAQKLDPATAYPSIPPGCRAGAGIGLLVALNACVALFSLWPFQHSDVEKEEVATPVLEVESVKKDEGGCL